jgi:hypothetical protein
MEELNIMMRKIFIHVGLHKTASTFLQEKLFPALTKTTYVGRPYTQQNEAFNKLQYADKSLYDPQYIQKELEKIKGDSILFSDELFSGIPECNYLNRSTIADRFSELFPEAEIILFIRGQADILLSHYYQSVKIGNTHHAIDSFVWRPQNEYTYEMYQQNQMRWDLRSRYYNHFSLNVHPDHFLYCDLIDLYKKRFKKVHVFLYEEFCKKPADVVQRLEEILEDKANIALEDLSKKQVNLRLKDNDIKIRRFENRLRSITSRKSMIKFLGSVYGLWSRVAQYDSLSDAEYVAKTVHGYYVDNNRKILNNYPAIPISEYPEHYQLG